jgi:hypothetical protein
MPIYPLLQNAPFGLEQIERMGEVFENVCRDLGLAAREDDLRDIVAGIVIECAHRGIVEPLALQGAVHDSLLTH